MARRSKASATRSTRSKRNYDPYDPPGMTAAARRQFEKEVEASERRKELSKHHRWEESKARAKPFGPKLKNNGAPKAGVLGGPGYAKKPRRERHRALRESVERDSYSTTAKRLQAQLNLGGMDPTTQRVLQGDKEWLEKHYSGAHSASTAPSAAAAKQPRKRAPYAAYKGRRYYEAGGAYRLTDPSGRTITFRSAGELKAHVDAAAPQTAPASFALARNPPGLFMSPNPLPVRANHHLTVGMRVRYLPLTGVYGVVTQTHPPDSYDVRWETTGIVQQGIDGGRLAPA